MTYRHSASPTPSADVEDQTFPVTSGQLDNAITPRRIRLPRRSSHRSPRQSPNIRPLVSDDDLDFQVIAIPSEAQPVPLQNLTPTKSVLSSTTPIASNDSNPPPLPNPRSSTSVDNPFYLSPTKHRPTFSELSEKYGFFKACLTIFLRFLTENWGILLFLIVVAVGLALLGALKFPPLRWKAWVAFALLSITLALLITNAVPPAVAMTLCVTAMLALKIVPPEKAIEGLSNTGVITVAILFIVAEGIQRTSVLIPIFRYLLGKPKFLWEAQLRIMIPVALISAFLNNTPVVLMLIPVVQSWSRRSNFPVSKLLMPLNNAAILGGTLTLLGTSTNLVVKGLVDKSGILGDHSLGIFGITPVGAILLAVGVLYMIVFSRCLLRDRGQTGVGAIIRNPREYTVALLVQERSPIVGETVQEAGLRHLQGLYLVEVTRADGTLIPAVAPDTRIEAGDTLLFAGVVETVTELYHIRGLVPAAGQSQKMKIERHHRRLVELVIASSSMLVGKTAKESKFRSRFQAAIIAVHRQGEHVKEKIADIKLRAGDTLLAETGTEFMVRFAKDSNFALVSEVSGSQPPREDKLHMAIALVIVIAMVAVATAGLLPLLSAAAVAAFLMIGTGCLSLTNAAQSVNIPVILIIAASFGISNGMSESGAAKALAIFIVDLFEPLGSIGLMFGVYFGTALLSAVITNNAAVTLMFPVIEGIIENSDSDVNLTYSLLYTLMIGASSSFSTPIGYQTNLMVHGPGGYTFMDWVVFGVPLQLLLGAAGVLSLQFIPFNYPSSGS